MSDSRRSSAVFDGHAVRMARRQQLIDRRVPIAERGPHRRIREEQTSVPVEQPDRVLERLDHGFDRRALAGERGAVGREPRGDGLERIAELGHFGVARKIDAHVEFAATQAREAAPDHVNRPKRDLRHEHRHERREQNGHGRGDERRPHLRRRCSA